MEACTRLLSAFRIAFDFVSDDVKQRVMQRYVKLLKEGAGDLIRQYEDAFLRGPDLGYVEQEDLPMVKEHLLARLGEENSLQILRIADGLGQFIEAAEVDKFVDPLARMAIGHPTPGVAEQATSALLRTRMFTSGEQDSWIAARLDAWLRLYDDKGWINEAEVVGCLKAHFEFDPDDPFAGEP